MYILFLSLSLSSSIYSLSLARSPCIPAIAHARIRKFQSSHEFVVQRRGTMKPPHVVRPAAPGSKPSQQDYKHKQEGNSKEVIGSQNHHKQFQNEPQHRGRGHGHGHGRGGHAGQHRDNRYGHHSNQDEFRQHRGKQPNQHDNSSRGEYRGGGHPQNHQNSNRGNYGRPYNNDQHGGRPRSGVNRSGGGGAEENTGGAPSIWATGSSANDNAKQPLKPSEQGRPSVWAKPAEQRHSVWATPSENTNSNPSVWASSSTQKRKRDD
eukprot:m.154788 g.154788  ORF g.154788 m.154788 type:complete len:264 (+) comp15085_c0_seq2:1522-2313(+)